MLYFGERALVVNLSIVMVHGEGGGYEQGEAEMEDGGW